MRWTVGVGSGALVAALGCTGGGGGTAVTLNLGPRMERLDRCSQGDAVGCAELAYDYETGKDGPVDLTAARNMYRKACDESVPQACEALAAMLQEGRGGAVDLPGAISFYVRACDGDDGAGCNNAALLLQGFEPADWSRIHALAERGCALDSANACAQLAISFATGRGVGEDAARAVPYLNRGCELGHRESCTAAADAYERGVGVAVDVERAKRLLERGCALGDARACR